MYLILNFQGCKSLEEIVELLKKNLDYKSKTILSTKKYYEYIIIYC